MDPSRRFFLQGSAAAALGFGGLRRLFAGTGGATPPSGSIPAGFGPLKPDPAGVIDLPEGFSYKILPRVGSVMDDGLLTPGLPDGMIALPGTGGRVFLIRNHEIDLARTELGPFGRENQLLGLVNPARIYDRGRGRTPSLGGTTTIVYNENKGEVVRHFMSLIGTERNCAGGPTPWNTWISCEETVQTAGCDREKDHGYCFEVAPSIAPVPVKPVPIREMGRFNHEAVAVDPGTGILYLTEDRPDGLLYRFIPKVPGALRGGGRLEALALRERKPADLRNQDPAAGTFPRGETAAVEWIPMEDVEAPLDDLRKRGAAAGCAVFSRGEGMWFAEGAVYFACTDGGPVRKGQIWKYFPSAKEGSPAEADAPGRLELFLEPNDGGLLDNADNLTMAPWGDLIVCEDGSGEQFVVGVTPEGAIYKFARNAAGESEFAGGTFSPSGKTFFVNIQTAGLTLAVTGPWRGRASS